MTSSPAYLPFRWSRVAATAAVLLVTLLAGLVPRDSLAQAEEGETVPPSPMTRLSQAGPIALGEVQVPIPTSGRAEWVALRSPGGFSDLPLASSSLALVELVRHVVAGQEDGWLGWERALNASTAELGRIDPAVAEVWDALFANALRGGEPSAGEATLRQQVVWAALYTRGSGAALLPDVCMPSGGAALDVATALARREMAVPAWRISGRDETLPLLPEEEVVRSALADSSGAAVGAVLVSLSEIDGTLPDWAVRLATALSPPIAAGGPAPLEEAPPPSSSAPVSPEATTHGDGWPAACDLGVVRLGAALQGLEPDEWNALHEAVFTMFDVASVPARVTWRAIVHAYLRSDREALDAIAALLPGEYTARDPSIPLVGALVTALGSEFGTGESFDLGRLRAETRTAAPSLRMWVEGELLRRQGSYAEAVEAFDEALSEDGWFFAALLGRASAHVLAGQSSEAAPDHLHLQRTAPDAAVYRTWVTALGERIRER